jgi:hypothetical protein
MGSWRWPVCSRALSGVTKDAKTFHRVIYRCLWPANPELGAADAEVQSTFEKHAADGAVTGVPTLTELLDKRVVDTALRWLGIGQAQHRGHLWNDTGNADRLADLYGHELIYCTERNSYYVWTGQQWRFDEFVEAEKAGRKNDARKPLPKQNTLRMGKSAKRS